MFGLKKTAYRFEVIHSDNINGEEIKDADGLINFVIGVNNHLSAMDEKGWLFIEKIKETKKDSTVLYVAKLELPLLEDNSYFDSLLSPFYTRKKVAYDSSLVSPLLADSTGSNENGIPELPGEFAALATKGKEELEQAVLPVNEKYQDQESKEEAEKASQEQENAALQQLQIEQLTYHLHLKQEELNTKAEELEKLKIEKQKKLLNDELMSLVTPPAEAVQKEVMPIVEPEPVKPVTQEIYTPVVADHSSDQVVTDMLDMVKTEFSSRLSIFVEEETKKINDEIKQLDTRETIDQDVTARLEAEKNRMIESESAILITKKRLFLKEEQQRHEAALATIEETYVKDKEERLTEILISFETKRKLEISEEYQRQTEQLSKIIQGKKEELSLRQKDLNVGLKDNFAQVLASFNENHEQVIQQIEKQKEQNAPIDFLARLKQA